MQKALTPEFKSMLFKVAQFRKNSATLIYDLNTTKCTVERYLTKMTEPFKTVCKSISLKEIENFYETPKSISSDVKSFTLGLMTHNYFRDIVLIFNVIFLSHSLYEIKKRKFLYRKSYLLEVLVVINDLFTNLHHVSRT